MNYIQFAIHLTFKQGISKPVLIHQASQSEPWPGEVGLCLYLSPRDFLTSSLVILCSGAVVPAGGNKIQNTKAYKLKDNIYEIINRLSS